MSTSIDSWLWFVINCIKGAIWWWWCRSPAIGKGVLGACWWCAETCEGMLFLIVFILANFLFLFLVWTHAFWFYWFVYLNIIYRVQIPKRVQAPRKSKWFICFSSRCNFKNYFCDYHNSFSSFDKFWGFCFIWYLKLRNCILERLNCVDGTSLVKCSGYHTSGCIVLLPIDVDG